MQKTLFCETRIVLTMIMNCSLILILNICQKYVNINVVFMHVHTIGAFLHLRIINLVTYGIDRYKVFYLNN